MRQRLHQIGVGLYAAGLITVLSTQAMIAGDLTHRILHDKPVLSTEKHRRCFDYAMGGTMAGFAGALGGIYLQYRHRNR